MEELTEAQPGFDMSKPAPVFSQSSIEADGFPILYSEAGQGDVLVCLQDGRLSRAHELMAQRRRFIAFETPGVGRSPARATSPKDLAHTMHAAVSSMGIDRFSIIANSFGAELALWMTIAQPQRVQAVVLLAPAAIRPAEMTALGNNPEARAAMHPAIDSKRQHRDAVPVPLSPELKVKKEAAAPQLSEPHRDDEFEVSLSSLETPVLALIGTEDPVISSATAQTYREKLRNFHLVMVYGAGGAMDAERPEAVAAIVDDFLTRGESFIVRNKSGIIYP